MQPTVKSPKAEVVAIGISTGGPKALSQLLPRIPSDIGVPILIVQHMPPVFTTSLANSIDEKCEIEVKEASNGEIILPNKVYIAPGGKQMKVAVTANKKSRIIRITDDPPENSCKPSVDYLFKSIADHYMDRSIGIIMTGMGSDGARGLKIMKEKGATIIAQDRHTCVVYGMPRGPIENGIVDTIVPLNKIADEILRAVRYGFHF
ncbi:CheB methylesterase domain-containing protein [Thermodesulfobacteriota bacterium]